MNERHAAPLRFSARNVSSARIVTPGDTVRAEKADRAEQPGSTERCVSLRAIAVRR
jgi:hypothetical protein